MFETQKKMMELEQVNRMLEKDIEWYRHCDDIKVGIIDKLTEENVKLRRNIEELERREFCCKNCRCLNDELKMENARLRKNMEEMKRIVGPAEFEKEIEELKEENKRLKENNDPFHLADFCEAANKDITKLKGMVERRDKELGELVDKISRKDRYINSLEEANEELESENRKLWDKLERIECVLEEEE